MSDTSEDISWFDRTPIVHRAHRVRWWAIGVWGLVAVGAAMSALRGSPETLRLWVPLAWFVWWLMWAPHVTLTREDVVIENPWARHTIPYGSVTEVTAGYQLTLHAGTHEFQAWAAPNDQISRTRQAYVRETVHAMRGRTSLPAIDRFHLVPSSSMCATDLRAWITQAAEAHSETAAAHASTRWKWVELAVSVALLTVALLALGGVL